MFGFIGTTVQGGWDAVNNVVSTVGKGASNLVSGFFPSEQRTSVQHLPIRQAENKGMTFRPTLPENMSMLETAKWAQQLWLDSPYEQQYGIPAMRTESQQLSQTVSATQEKGWGESLADIFAGLKSGIGEARQIYTMADELLYDIGLSKREPIRGIPREGSPEGQNETHLNSLINTGASVIETIKTAGGAFLDQAKGLFNLGFPQGDQAAFAIKHELEPSGKTTIGIGIVIAIILGVILLGRKK